MARSIKKGFFVDYHLLEKVQKAAKVSGARKPIQYFKVCRRALISLKTHMERWEDFTRYERRDLLELYRQVKTALPKELQ